MHKRSCQTALLQNIGDLAPHVVSFVAINTYKNSLQVWALLMWSLAPGEDGQTPGTLRGMGCFSGQAGGVGPG